MKRLIKKCGFWILVLLIVIIAGVHCWGKLYTEDKKMEEEEGILQWEKGYDLLVDDREREEAEDGCKKVMELIFDIYLQADKGEASNVVLTDETVLEMQNKVSVLGYPVTSTVIYADMENYELVDSFLKKCMEGKSGSVIIYEIQNDGGIGRNKYIFDGTDMYALSVRTAWNDANNPTMTYVSYNKINEWKYTDKGWFCYKLCVPEPPEVTEIVDGSCLVRIKPMTEERREMSERCVRGLGYQGNNLLCSDWDKDHMEELDYNGMYEYLYEMKNQKRFNPENYPEGIPKEEFENLIMEYLPITTEQIREYAVFDAENQTYVWMRLGCFNYTPTFFGTSLPEVTDIKENEDGTVTLTVEAVCDVVVCDDAVITHELTVRFEEDGSFRYLGNKILNDGIKNIPQYQYRIRVSTFI
ncbi:MAG: hypothetical protein K2N34_16360 [Lachnospiraceae bacterium]|nr:hypothetical protein [Lachnospiraceae bacterium]